MNELRAQVIQERLIDVEILSLWYLGVLMVVIPLKPEKTSINSRMEKPRINNADIEALLSR